MHHQRTSQSPLHPCAMTSPSRSCLHLVPSSRTAPEQHPQCPMVEVSLCCAQHQRRQACRPPTRPAAAPTPPAALAMPCKPYNMRATRICVHPETRWRHKLVHRIRGAPRACARALRVIILEQLHTPQLHGKTLHGRDLGHATCPGPDTRGGHGRPARSAHAPRTLCGQPVPWTPQQPCPAPCGKQDALCIHVASTSPCASAARSAETGRVLPSCCVHRVSGAQHAVPILGNIASSGTG